MPEKHGFRPCLPQVLSVDPRAQIAKLAFADYGAEPTMVDPEQNVGERLVLHVFQW